MNIEQHTPQTICVTGASGFIGAHIVEQLLAKGHRVRATVRTVDEQKYDYLLNLPNASTHLSLHAAQLLNEGDYDQIVKGCDAVIHTASPYVIDVVDAKKDLVDPAVNGTINVLKACANAPGVKRVVVTSSMAAITDEPTDDHPLTEADWNTKSSLTRNPYYYSKAQAERAAWAYVEAHHPKFDLVVINPFLVIGPSIGPNLNTSNAMLRDIIEGVYPGIFDLTWGIVDVRDVARAHILAIEQEHAQGRYVCANDTMTMKEVVAILKEEAPGKKLPKLNMTSSLSTGLVKLLSYAQPKGTGTYLRTNLGRSFTFEHTKIQNDLGLEFTAMNQSIVDAVQDLKKWGHLNAN